MGLGLKNQFILVKTINFLVLVPQELSVESSINDDVYEKRVSSLFRRNIEVHTQCHSKKQIKINFLINVLGMKVKPLKINFSLY